MYLAQVHFYLFFAPLNPYLSSPAWIAHPDLSQSIHLEFLPTIPGSIQESQMKPHVFLKGQKKATARPIRLPPTLLLFPHYL